MRLPDTFYPSTL